MTTPTDDQLDRTLSVIGSSSSSAAVTKFFHEYKADGVKQTSSDQFSRSEIDEILGALKASFKTKHNITDADFPYHVLFILIRCARLGTSPHIKYRYSYEYTINSVNYKVSDAWVFGEILNICKKFDRPNSVRSFACTLEDAYLWVTNSRPDLIRCKTAARKGVPSGNEHLAADFLSGSSTLLTDAQKAIVLASSRHAIENSVNSQSQRMVVSLYDYGKY